MRFISERRSGTRQGRRLSAQSVILKMTGLNGSSWRGHMNPSCHRNCLTRQMQGHSRMKRKMCRQDGKHSQSLSVRTVGDGLSLPLGGMPTDADRQRPPALRNAKQSMWTKSCLRTPYYPVHALWREWCRQKQAERKRNGRRRQLLKKK